MVDECVAAGASSRLLVTAIIIIQAVSAKNIRHILAAPPGGHHVIEIGTTEVIFRCLAIFDAVGFALSAEVLILVDSAAFVAGILQIRFRKDRLCLYWQFISMQIVRNWLDLVHSSYFMYHFAFN